MGWGKEGRPGSSMEGRTLKLDLEEHVEMGR